MNKTEKLRRSISGYIMIFLSGCTAGWIYETLFYSLTEGQFIKRGQGFGPWLPVYGVGTILLYLSVYRFKNSKIILFIACALGSGLTELISGMALFHFGNGLRLWDYNTEIWNFGNIGGYVCLRSILVFGLFGVLFTYIIIPFISKKVLCVKKHALAAVTIPLAVLFTADIIYGYIFGLCLRLF